MLGLGNLHAVLDPAIGERKGIPQLLSYLTSKWKRQKPACFLTALEVRGSRIGRGQEAANKGKKRC